MASCVEPRSPSLSSPTSQTSPVRIAEALSVFVICKVARKARLHVKVLVWIKTCRSDHGIAVSYFDRSIWLARYERKGRWRSAPIINSKQPRCRVVLPELVSEFALKFGTAGECSVGKTKKYFLRLDPLDHSRDHIDRRFIRSALNERPYSHRSVSLDLLSSIRTSIQRANGIALNAAHQRRQAAKDGPMSGSAAILAGSTRESEKTSGVRTRNCNSTPLLSKILRCLSSPTWSNSTFTPIGPIQFPRRTAFAWTNYTMLTSATS